MASSCDVPVRDMKALMASVVHFGASFFEDAKFCFSGILKDFEGNLENAHQNGIKQDIRELAGVFFQEILLCRFYNEGQTKKI